MGNADDRVAVGSELVSNGEGVVATNGNEGADADVFEDGAGEHVGVLAGAGIGAGGAEHGAALVEDAGDVAGGHFEMVAFEDAGPAVAKCLDLPSDQGGFADDGADGGVKAGTVSPAGEDPNYELILR